MAWWTCHAFTSMPHAHGERSLICSARKYEIYILINVCAFHVPSTRHWGFLVGFDRLFRFVFVFLFSCFGVVLFCRAFMGCVGYWYYMFWAYSGDSGLVISLHYWLFFFFFLTGTFIKSKWPEGKYNARRQKQSLKSTTEAKMAKVVNRDEESLNSKPRTNLT